MSGQVGEPQNGQENKQLVSGKRYTLVALTQILLCQPIRREDAH
jgi:hypothetical protein